MRAFDSPSSIWALTAPGVAACVVMAGACLPDLQLGPPGSGGASASTASGGSVSSSAGGAAVGGNGGAPAGTGGTAGAAGSASAAGGSTDCGAVCSCSAGMQCNFSCAMPPCDVNCSGASTCVGECGNATCNCQGGSICHFVCVAPNCQVSCTQGSQCVLDCGNLTPGSASCDFQPCQGATPLVCSDNQTMVCNAVCP